MEMNSPLNSITVNITKLPHHKIIWINKTETSRSVKDYKTTSISNDYIVDLDKSYDIKGVYEK